MTTRKEFLARIAAMPLGTQEQLDAAADDATLIPFDTLFADKFGDIVSRLRQCGDTDHKDYVWMAPAFGEQNCYAASELRVLPEGDEC